MQMAWGCCRGAFRPEGSPVLMVPNTLAFAGQLHINGLSLPLVRAEVAATILELFQVFDGMRALGRGHGPHSKRQGHLYTDTCIITYVGYTLYKCVCIPIKKSVLMQQIKKKVRKEEFSIKRTAGDKEQQRCI